MKFSDFWNPAGIRREPAGPRHTITFLTVSLLALGTLLNAGCAEQAGEPAPAPAAEPIAADHPDTEGPLSEAAADHAQVTEPVPSLAADITICTVPDPQVPSSAFEVFNSAPDETGDYWVRYSCKQDCAEWQQCHVPAHMEDGGDPIMHGRAPDRAKRALAFVVDGMGGHLVFSEDGEKTVLIHSGAGGTRHYTAVADSIERQSAARTALVRWEKGFVGNVVRTPPFPGPVQWGWYSRTSPEATTLRALNRRVASLIAWTHHHLAAGNPFGTMGCSMGTNATFMPVLWHGLDPIIDYQLFVGGPNMWDLNAQCGRRQYTRGHCDLDAVTACERDEDCSAAGPQARCHVPRPYTEINAVFDQFANHVHVTTACHIESASPDTEPYPPFDESSMGYVADADWSIGHHVDFLVNVGREMNESGLGGDEYWALGDFMYIYNRIQPAEHRQWHAVTDSNHCDAMTSGAGVDMIIDRMNL